MAYSHKLQALPTNSELGLRGVNIHKDNIKLIMYLNQVVDRTRALN